MDFKNHRLNNTTVTTGLNNINTTVTIVGKNYRLTEALYEDLSDLVNPTFKKWYCKHFHRLGKDRVLQLASVARNDGLEPRKLFSKLLKEA